MYKLHDDNVLTITVNDWLNVGLTYNQFNHDSKLGHLKIAKRGINGNTLIDVKSIRKPDRLKVIESAFGKIEKKAPAAVFNVEIDQEALVWFTKYRKANDLPLEPENITKYVNRASIFRGIKRGLEIQMAARAKAGKRVNKGEFWSLAVDWYQEQMVDFPCAPISNPRILERAFKEYLNDVKRGGYWSILHKNEGNDGARKVSAKLERLFMALWRANDKPFMSVVLERYNEFISGAREFHDTNTGEDFKPEDFIYKNRAPEVSIGTVWNYLKNVVNETAVYSDRNGNFDFVNTKRPKHHRKHGRYSLSKISMDDVALSRKSHRGWVNRYIAVDVVSGYWFRPAYIIGKPNTHTVYESFRNMFCELIELGLPMPGELEVEYHLMQHLEWLNEAFPHVRFCESPTEKRAEHAIKALKYGVSKKEGHTRGRWYGKHEAYRSVRKKVDGDFIEPKFDPLNIIADDLSDVEKHNNTLHPLQKTYPGLTRKQVLLKNINPSLKAIDSWYLYKFIGNQTETSIYNNDYCPVSNEKFEIADFASLKRLKPNNLEVTAYWLPNEEGSITKVYLWQGESYIGEANNRVNSAYNECAVERTDDDRDNMLSQQKRVAKFDSFIKAERSELPKIGTQLKKDRELIESMPVKTVPATTPEKVIEKEVDDIETTDWSAFAINSL